ncbi:MAG: DUF1707 SHOCT-like domain-containing protein [Micromonosporaceae bacterium]
MNTQIRAAAVPPVDGGRGMRASDADRDQAASVLGVAFAEGMLTVEEHGERLDAVYAARTWQQLRQVTADLPTGNAAGPAGPGSFAGADRCMLCVLLIVCPPAGLAWWLLSRHGSGAGTDIRLTPGRAAEGEVPQQVQYAQDR